jgi:hypothetical protein
MPKKSPSQKENLQKRGREKITIVLDSDILDFFRARASQPDSPKYQAQINNELRRIVEANKQSKEIGLSEFENSILENDVFVKMLKEKMKKV